MHLPPANFRLPRGQFGSMVVQNRKQLFVVDVPQSAAGLILTEKPQMGKQLA
jgi:hypothetical protein